MEVKFYLKDELFEKLQNKSRETGIGSDELVNEILNQGLDNYPNLIKLSDKFRVYVEYVTLGMKKQFLN